MMRISTLELVLTAERQRRQASKTGAGFARPVLCERVEDVANAPFFVSNSRGSFVLGQRRSSDGTVRMAFVNCPMDKESLMLIELHRTLWATSVQHNWPNRCSSISQATARMAALGMESGALVVSSSFLEEACGKALSVEDAEKMMLMQGYVAQVDGLKILASDLPTGTAILTSPRAQAGIYVRSEGHLAVLIRRANRSLVLVGKDDVA